VLVDPEAGALAYRPVPGTSLLDRPVADPARLAPALGGFLGAVHATPLAAVEDLVAVDAHPLAAWHAEVAADVRALVADALPSSDRRAVAAFLDRPTPPDPPGRLAVCHHDLGAEHVLADAGRHVVTGVIDWADAAIADPAYALALLRRDLGDAVLVAVLAAYDRPLDAADRERAVFLSPRTFA
jgi:aminoglycoside phosphotransferase (APT) family kinase protein